MGLDDIIAVGGVITGRIGSLFTFIAGVYEGWFKGDLTSGFNLMADAYLFASLSLVSDSYLALKESGGIKKVFKDYMEFRKQIKENKEDKYPLTLDEKVVKGVELGGSITSLGLVGYGFYQGFVNKDPASGFYMLNAAIGTAIITGISSVYLRLKGVE